MAHTHRMEDSDPHFQIDGDTRELIYTSPDKLTIIQHDHNSEIVTFDMPKEIDGHDMRDCDNVQVHFINTDVNYSGTFIKGSSTVTDLHVSENNKDVLVFSWAIPRSATSLVGPLAFAIRFACTDGPDADYVWHTKVYAGMFVSPGLNVEGMASEMVDHFQEWYYKLTGDIEQALDAILALQKELISQPKLIAFTILDTEYTATEGMTWTEWIDSEYNIDGFYIDSELFDGGVVVDAQGSPIFVQVDVEHCKPSDIIMPNGIYGWE